MKFTYTGGEDSFNFVDEKGRAYTISVVEYFKSTLEQMYRDKDLGYSYEEWCAKILGIEVLSCIDEKYCITKHNRYTHNQLLELERLKQGSR